MTVPRRRRSVVLPVVALALFASIPLRVLTLVDGWSALASEPAAIPQPAAAAGQPVAVACAPRSAEASDASLVAEVARRNAELNRRESAISLREAQVAAAAQLAGQQVTELRRMRETVERLVVRQASASDADMKLLVGLYSNMKPAPAAALLGSLAPPQAAEILQHLQTETAGPILAAMDPAAAVKVTEELQQRGAAFRD